MSVDSSISIFTSPDEQKKIAYKPTNLTWVTEWFTPSQLNNDTSDIAIEMDAEMSGCVWDITVETDNNKRESSIFTYGEDIQWISIPKTTNRYRLRISLRDDVLTKIDNWKNTKKRPDAWGKSWGSEWSPLEWGGGQGISAESNIAEIRVAHAHNNL